MLLKGPDNDLSINIDPSTGIIEVQKDDWLTKYLSVLTGSKDPEVAAELFEKEVNGSWVPFSEGLNPNRLEMRERIRFTPWRELAPLPVDAEDVPMEATGVPMVKDKLLEGECRSLGSCRTRIGIDIERESGPLKRFEGPKVDVGLDNGPGGDVVLGSRSSWRVPWGEVSAEGGTARAADRLKLDWQSDSVIPTDLDLDVGATASAGALGTVFGSEERNVSGGVSLGPGLGLRMAGHGVDGGKERYSVGVDFLIFNLGFTYTTDPN